MSASFMRPHERWFSLVLLLYGFSASAQPDLTITTAITISPTSVAAGESVSMSGWTVANVGNVTSNSFSNGFYLSTNSFISTSDTFLTGNSNSGLAPGTSFKWGGPTLTIPAGTAPGDYYIGILVDRTNTNAESNENNNFVSTPITVKANQPDLTITTPITISPTSVAAGGSVSMSGWTVANAGDVTSSSFSNGFYLSSDATITAGDTFLTGNSNSGLAPGASFNWGGPTLTIPASTPPGNYHIGILVDRTNTNAESNENNNFVSTPITVKANQPDLTITTAITISPSSVAPGGSVTMSGWTVANVGDVTSSSFSNGFYLSTDATITAGDTFLTGNSNSGLAPGASFNWGGPTLTIPASTAPGDYFIGILVDRTDANAESDETNNFVSTPITVTALAEMEPDLTITTAITISPTSAAPGESISMSGWTVANVGDASSGSFSNGFYLSTDATITAGDTFLTSNSNSGLAPGASFNWGGPTLTIPASTAPGDYFIGILVDRTNTNAESDETNNFVSTPITVTSSASAEPDLTITTPITITPTSVFAGESVQMSGWTVANVGDATSSSFSNGFYLSSDATITAADTYLTGNSNSGLASGASFNWGGPTLTIPASTAPGDYFIGILVDRTNTNAESDETNNFVSTPITVTSSAPAEPDLTITTVITITPTSVFAGESVQMSGWTVANVGNATSGFFSNGFYLSTDATITAGDTFLTGNSNSGLAPGASFQWGGPTLTIPASTAPGDYFIGILVDRTDTNAESDETNNFVSTPITVLSSTPDQPDLTIISISANPVVLTVNEQVLISAVVQNIGGVISADTTLWFVQSLDSTLSADDAQLGSVKVGQLDSGETFADSINASFDSSGTFFVGACVDQVVDEFDVDNNCSEVVQVTVSDQSNPDLVVSSITATPSTVQSGEMFAVSATARNQGSSSADPTTLRFFESTDAGISTADLELGDAPIAGLAGGATQIEEIMVAAPQPGIYHYGACLDAVTGESSTSNNCSAGFQVTVNPGGPDLTVNAPTVFPSNPTAGDTVQITVVVSNQGDEASPATTLSYLLSSDSDIDAATDTLIGSTSVVSNLNPDRSATVSTLAQLNQAGSFFIGACAGAVVNETNLDNNCSSGTALTVAAPNLVKPAVTATLTDSFALDQNQNGLANDSDIILYTAVLTNDSTTEDADQATLLIDDLFGLTLRTGTVQASDQQAIIIEGNGIGDNSVEVQIPTLAANGGTLEISFELVVDLQQFPGPTVEVQGRVDGNNFSTLFTDDPDTVESLDATATPVAGTVDLLVLLTDELLVDNDGDGLANPTDIIKYSVTLENGGDQAAGPLSFIFQPPAGAALISDRVRGNALLDVFVLEGNAPDDTEILVEIPVFKGGDTQLSDAITFELGVVDPPGASRIEAQGQVVVGDVSMPTSTALTDDPSLTGDSDPTVMEIGPLLRIDPEGSDTGKFGSATASSEDFVVVGSPDANSGKGLVKVYTIDEDGNRNEDTTILAPPGAASFGVSVDIEEKLLVVGASGVSSPGTPGQVFVYERQSESWILIDSFTDGLPDAEFGAKVDIDGVTVVVGAPGDGEGEDVPSGAIYTYTLSLGKGNFVGKFKPPELANTNARFGASLSCNAGTIAVGAPGQSGSSVQGTVHLLSVISGNLSSIGSAELPSTIAADDRFGESLHMSGETLVVGAPGDPNDMSNSGQAFVYDIGANFGQLTQTITPDAAGGARFGQAVQIGDNEIYVGAPFESTASSNTEVDNLGAVFQYQLQENAFVRAQKIGAFVGNSDAGTENQEGFGQSISLFGNRLVIGAPESRNGVGGAAVRVSPEDIVFADGFETN